MTSLTVPDFPDLLEELLKCEVKFNGKANTLDGYRREYLSNAAARRQLDKIQIFGIFVSALLERAVSGGNYELRKAAFAGTFKDFADVTRERALWVLKKTGYRWPEGGVEVILAAKDVVDSTEFAWEDFFTRAEDRYREGFDNPFLQIRHVGRKVSDFALLEFSTYYCAIDAVLSRVLARTGLVVLGYTKPSSRPLDFGTAPSDGRSYLFMKSLITEFAEASGWSPSTPSEGVSPGEIDYILWFFGQQEGICTTTPRCANGPLECPISSHCLAFKGSQLG